jgi:Protein of unknown function (DUF4435)
MLGAIGAANLANTVRLMRVGYEGAILLVEGPSDARVYGRMVEAPLCRVVPGYGKERTLEALEILIRDRVPGVAGVVDADFARILGGSPASANIFVTDAHDLEMVMIASPAFEKVVEEFASPGKVKGENVRQVILTGGEIIGCLRLVSTQMGLDHSRARPGSARRSPFTPHNCDDHLPGYLRSRVLR